MKPKRIEILGVPLDCVTMESALNLVDTMIKGSTPQAIVAVNPEKVIKAQQDRFLLDQLKSSGLLIPDGIGVVLAARLLGLGRMERVPGSELMPAICARAAMNGYRIFLFGANPDVNERTAKALCDRFPGINIVGRQHGYLKDDEMPRLIDQINASGAEILFIALGSPKQERWIHAYLPQLKIKVCQGVGGTFDVICGKVRRAPLVFRKIHLEWLYRLMTQPSRILRQSALPQFTWKVFLARIIPERCKKQ